MGDADGLAAAAATDTTCYICFGGPEDGPLLDVCACKDRLVHVECQRRMMVGTTRSTKCPVCETVYGNVLLKPSHLRLTNDAAVLLVLTLCVVALTSLGVYQLCVFVFVQRYDGQDLYSVIAVISGCICLAIVTVASAATMWLAPRGRPLLRRRQNIVLIGLAQQSPAASPARAGSRQRQQQQEQSPTTISRVLTIEPRPPPLRSESSSGSAAGAAAMTTAEGGSSSVAAEAAGGERV